MIAFKIHLNGEKLCVAGIGEHGVLAQHLTWSQRKPKADAEEKPDVTKTRLHVGGLANDEHVDWIKRTEMSVGDEVVIKIVEVESADEPTHRERAESDEERAQKVRDGLANVKALLPSPLVEGEWLASLRGYEEFMAANESRMAVKVLANLGDLNNCAPEFWAALRDIAVELQMYRQASGFSEKADANAE